MTKHGICRRVGFLEQRRETDTAELTPRASDAVDASAKILTYLADRGFAREGNESVAEVYARAFGISCRELKDQLRAASDRVPATLIGHSVGGEGDEQ